MPIKNRKVLIVDDEVELCRTISSYLKARKFATYEASNGLLALKAIDKVLPDIIILDVVMPEMDGFELLKKLKGTPRYSKIPVIMLTAKSRPEDLAKGIDLQSDFYLPKPASLKNLMNFINLIFAH